jgi:alpha-N-arabinofuranosidase
MPARLLLVVTVVLAPVLALAADPTTVTLDLSKPGAPVSPTFYGLMTEEINHSYDGGLYGELVQNRTFQDDKNVASHWVVVADGVPGSISLDETHPVAGTALTTCVKLDATHAAPGHRVGLANDGFWGIPVRPKTTYRASFYAMGSSKLASPLTVSLESSDGAKTFASAQVPAITGAWAKYDVTLSTGGDVTPSTTNRFVISTETPGTYWLNLVSLFAPTFNDRPNGNRPDIMQKLIDLKPTFLRLPGGNYLEGDTIATRFNWKTTIHDLAQRPGHPGCWGYRSSDGLGLLEYLDWCEDMHAQPVLAVYAGYSLKGEHTEAGPALQPFVDDALDEIEYVTGDASTKWGAERAKDGHPAPFPLTYVEVGNEDAFDKSKSYDGRFAQFYDAIKAKYPKLEIIATTKVTSRTPDLMDDHYYRSAGAMEHDATHYDKASRTGPKIFVGEWATVTGADPKTRSLLVSNLECALADAAWLTGLERNSDLVVMESYAPLFINVNPGAHEWTPDLIGYDGLSTYGGPAYYVQKMFADGTGDTILPVDVANNPTWSWQPPTPKNATAPPPLAAIPTLFFSATTAKSDGTVYLKIVNVKGAPQTVQINLNGAASVSPDATLTTLTSAHTADNNSIAEPTKIAPVDSAVHDAAKSFTLTVAPYSANVLTLRAK